MRRLQHRAAANERSALPPRHQLFKGQISNLPRALPKNAKTKRQPRLSFSHTPNLP